MRRWLHELINQSSIKKILTTNRYFVKLYFNTLYRRPDPYRVYTAAEVEKFERAFALLGDRNFQQGLEIGCGEGRNTWRLAERCDRVLALDISRVAIRRAQKMTLLPNVDFQVADIVTRPLPEGCDYIFCSEVLYYLHLDQLDPVIEKIVLALQPDGWLHLVHSRSIKDDTSGLPWKAFGARTIHERFLQRPELHLVADEQTDQYRITLLQKRKRNPSRA